MNQHRCETCKKPHLVPDGLSRHPHFFCCDEELPFEVPNVTAIRGCASHSSFQTDQVLDKLHNWFENYCEGNEDPDLWMAFLHAERAFRKSKDGEL